MVNCNDVPNLISAPYIAFAKTVLILSRSDCEVSFTGCRYYKYHSIDGVGNETTEVDILGITTREVSIVPS